MSVFPSYPDSLEILSIEDARKRPLAGAVAVMRGTWLAEFIKLGDGPLTACSPNQTKCTPPIDPLVRDGKPEVVCVFWADPAALSTSAGAVMHVGKAAFAVLEPGGDDQNPGDIVAKSSAPRFALIELRGPHDAFAQRADMIGTCFYFPHSRA